MVFLVHRPQTVPAMPGAELAASMLTATEVGGDFYDFDYQPGGVAGKDARDGTLNTVIGDGTGHGPKPEWWSPPPPKASSRGFRSTAI